MFFHFENLDEETRGFMVREVELDIEENNLYRSKRFNEIGGREYPRLIKEAVDAHDENWLASQLRQLGCFKVHEERKKKGGGFIVADVPRTAPDTFAEGEFNRFYIRGVCARALNEGVPSVEVCRGKQVAHPRPESEAMIGDMINAESLLADLRRSPGVEPAFGLPSGPNSGLTVKLPTR